MKEIRLTHNKIAIVDDADYEKLIKYTWMYDSLGYAARHIIINGKKTMIRMHREILDAPKGKQVDHWNMDKLDNRKENIRLCSYTENRCNQHKRSDNKSGVKGVSWSKVGKKWIAQIAINKQSKHLGYFKKIEDAAEAYKNAAKQYHGDFSRTE